MFNLFKSNRMENLMAAFAGVLAQTPKDPMASEWISVQSRGMKQWVTASLADSFGISANIQFVFPKQIVSHILSSAREPASDDPVMDESFFFWSVLAQLMKIKTDNGININLKNESKNDFYQLKNYIKDDDTGKKKFQLAKRIATLFDDYTVYRPDMLLNWQNRDRENQARQNQTRQKSNNLIKLNDPQAAWQAMLWNQAVADLAEHHLAFKTDQFLKHASSNGPSVLKIIEKKNLPARISFFGISALPPVFLQIIEKISSIIDIHMFFLVPSNLFFFDMKSKRQALKAAISNQAHEGGDFFFDEMINPLLSSLGTSGQHFLSQIENYNYQEPGPDLFYDPLNENGMEKKSMLTVLQSDILNIIHRKPGKEDQPERVEKTDTSICIHACHSPMREAQVLKDLLLDVFAKEPDIAPHDIIVMMPDIESYAPFIESVFSLEEKVPFSISDRKKRSESEPLEAFSAILSLQGSRLEQSQVLDVMAYESVALTFGFETADLTKIKKMLTDANILWGKDNAHRESLGMPGFKENTWQFGIERLFLGMAMPEHSEFVINGVLPCDSFEGSDLEVLGKFSKFCSTLFSCLNRLNQPKTIEKWCRTLIHICEHMMSRQLKNNSDIVFLYQQIDTIKKGANMAGFEGKVPFEIIQSLMIRQLDIKVSQGNFLAGKVTFCNIMPMRSIPYKIVVLMGMDEGAFPRQVFGPGFNLMDKYPRLGDKNERLEDRYLFLETLISVRCKMIITYTGLDIRDNSPIPCSGVVSELMDVMDDSFDFPDDYKYHISHPLHPFNAAYFKDEGGLFSFSADNFQIAKALLEAAPEKRVFIQPPDIKTKSAHTKKQKTSFENRVSPALAISMDEFIRYFRNPVEWMMKQTLRIGFPHLEQETRDRENFTIAGLDQYVLGSWLVEQQEVANNKTDHYPTLKAMGSLPYGQKGKAEYQKLQQLAGPIMNAAQTVLSQKKRLPIVQQIELDELTMNIHIKNIRQDGLTVVNFGKLNGARLLSGWIQHLFLNVCAPEGYPKQTRLIGRDPNGKKSLIIIEFKALDGQGLQYLNGLAMLYNKGLNIPLCFFCETSYQFVKVMVKHKFDMNQETLFDAMNRVKRFWNGAWMMKGDKENRYVDLCFSTNDPFESLEIFKSSGFIDNAMIVFKPMLDHIKVVS